MSGEHGNHQHFADPAPNPGLWLGLSILATLACCLPAGVVGIVYAAQALEAQNRGDLETSANRVAKARTWTQLALVGGFIMIGLVICLNVAGG